MKEKFDFEKWERRDIFNFYKNTSCPFYSVTFRQDVTPLYRYVKERGLSFYLSLVYLCTKAVNMTEAFRVVVRDGEFYRTDRRLPSFTDLKKGSEAFHIVTMDKAEDVSLEDFVRMAKRKSELQTEFIEYGEESDELIYFSCLPWIDITSLTNERDFPYTDDRDKEEKLNDSVPRIAWGKYVKDGDRITLGISVEVNHRFADGVHIGKFAENLTRLIEEIG